MHRPAPHTSPRTSCAPLPLQTRGVGEPLHAIPPAARAVADRIQALPGAVAIDQLTVNEYSSGVGIAPHVGKHGAGWGQSLWCVRPAA